MAWRRKMMRGERGRGGRREFVLCLRKKKENSARMDADAGE